MGSLATTSKAQEILGEVFRHIVHAKHRDIQGWATLGDLHDDWCFRCQACNLEWTISGDDVRRDPQLKPFKMFEGPEQVIAIMLKTPEVKPARPNAWEKLQDGFLDDA